MTHYDLLVIGFGKAGKTLAAKMSSLGKKVALVEKDSQMYGGTCINIGCIPTKTLITAAEQNLTFDQAMTQKEAVVSRLRQKNKAGLQGAGVDLYHAQAEFLSDKIVKISAGQEEEQLSAETIVINTGAKSSLPPIPGLSDTVNVVDSTGLQTLQHQPARLGVIGAGNIGLEFASLYSRLGSQVTVFENSDRILSRDEASIAQLAQDYLKEDGVNFHFQAQVEAVKNNGQAVILTANSQDYTFDAVLYATGRQPNTEQLGLENTHIEVTERGAIKVDDYCQTSVPGVYAVGDVNGGPQFTYISLDDFRIVFGHLTGQGDYRRSQRQNIPTTSFITPPLSRVGMTEQEAIEAGLPYMAKELAVATMPRAHVNNDLRGLFKVIVHKESQEILGASLLGKESPELINLIKLAMDNRVPYTYIRDQIFTHPSMAENLNDLFNF